MSGAAGDERALCAVGSEQRDVPGEEHDVERAAEIERGEVVLVPLDAGSVDAGGGEHRPVDVDAGYVDAPARELDRHAPGSTTGVEHRCRCATHHERRLSVHVDTSRRQLVEASLIVVTVPTAHGSECRARSPALVSWPHA